MVQCMSCGHKSNGPKPKTAAGPGGPIVETDDSSNALLSFASLGSSSITMPTLINDDSVQVISGAAGLKPLMRQHAPKLGAQSHGVPNRAVAAPEPLQRKQKLESAIKGLKSTSASTPNLHSSSYNVGDTAADFSQPKGMPARPPRHTVVSKASRSGSSKVGDNDFDDDTSSVGSGHVKLPRVSTGELLCICSFGCQKQALLFILVFQSDLFLLML